MYSKHKTFIQEGRSRHSELNKNVLSVFMYSSDFQCGCWRDLAQFVCKNNSNQFSLRSDEVSKSVMKRVRSVNAVNYFVIGLWVPQLLS